MSEKTYHIHPTVICPNDEVHVICSYKDYKFVVEEFNKHDRVTLYPGECNDLPTIPLRAFTFEAKERQDDE